MATTFKMVDGDIFFDVNGRLKTIEGFEKVSQDLSEVLLTQFDLARDYGSELPTVDADPSYNVSEQQVSSFVMDAVERLRSLQRSNFTTTSEEKIASIDAVEVHKNDQTEILFGLAVTTASGIGLTTAAQLKQSVSLNQLFPPGTREQDADIRAAFSKKDIAISGEEYDGS